MLPVTLLSPFWVQCYPYGEARSARLEFSVYTKIPNFYDIFFDPEGSLTRAVTPAKVSKRSASTSLRDGSVMGDGWWKKKFFLFKLDALVVHDK